MSTVVAEVLEGALAERIQRLASIKDDLDAIEQRVRELGDLSNVIYGEIKELKDAYYTEIDHLERAAA